MDYRNAGALAPSLGAVQNQREQPSRESHVGSQMSRQGKIIQTLHEQFSTLEQRLQPVLRSTPPNTTGQSGQEKPSLVGHAMALSNQNDQLENLSIFMSDILERLEI